MDHLEIKRTELKTTKELNTPMKPTVSTGLIQWRYKRALLIP